MPKADVEELDEQGDQKVAPVVEEKPKPAPAVEEKVTLSLSELDERIKAGVAAREQENAERIRAEEAVKQGNFQTLYEDAQKAAYKANLALWRTRALNKFKLGESLFDALSGETEEEIMASAKKLDAHIKAEVAARAELNPPPDPGRKTIPTEKGKVDTKVQTRAIMKNVFGLGRVH